MTLTAYPALNRAIWVVWMSGFGGNVVVLLPHGAVYYHFSDNDECIALSGKRSGFWE